MTLADVGLPPLLTADPPALRDLGADRADWLRRYARTLVLVDSLILLAASLVALLARFGVGASDQRLRGVSYVVGSLLLLPVWIAVLSLSRCYETRFLGNGTEEFKRVANASFRVVAVIVFVAFMTKTEVARGFLAVALPVGMVGVVAGRYGGRLWLHRQRRRGLCMHSVVIVGPAAAALEMTTRVQSVPLSGLQVVGACIFGDTRRYAEGSLVPVLGSLSEVIDVLAELGADTVCVAHGPGVTSDMLRDLSHDLEGTGVDLLVSPMLTNVTGTRLSRRAIPGLPLLHIDEPELTGSRRLVKALFDRTVGLLLLLLSSPVLIGLALAVRCTSRGPAFFRQERVGKAGSSFRIWKLRSMYVDAEARRAQLISANVHGEGGMLFKIHDDPRVTPIGRLLRRFSLDELPQLLNVVCGQMSLVGPRPPLRGEVDRYDSVVHRRLLVKPGMTGLWQVSGRSDLPWEESVRLDLDYVENWSLGLDIAVLCKTVIAVLRPSGAY